MKSARCSNKAPEILTAKGLFFFKKDVDLRTGHVTMSILDINEPRTKCISAENLTIGIISAMGKKYVVHLPTDHETKLIAKLANIGGTPTPKQLQLQYGGASIWLPAIQEDGKVSQKLQKCSAEEFLAKSKEVIDALRQEEEGSSTEQSPEAQGNPRVPKTWCDGAPPSSPAASPNDTRSEPTSSKKVADEAPKSDSKPATDSPNRRTAQRMVGLGVLAGIGAYIFYRNRTAAQSVWNQQVQPQLTALYDKIRGFRG